MKQTAVEWLENQIMTSKYFYSLMKELNSRGTIVQPNVFEQAKEMEKEQIKFFFKKGHLYSGCPYGLEECYKKTFKSE